MSRTLKPDLWPHNASPQGSDSGSTKFRFKSHHTAAGIHKYAFVSCVLHINKTFCPRLFLSGLIKMNKSSFCLFPSLFFPDRLWHLILLLFCPTWNRGLRLLIKDNPFLCAASPRIWMTTLSFCHCLPNCVVEDKRLLLTPTFEAFNWAWNYEWVLNGGMSRGNQTSSVWSLPTGLPASSTQSLFLIFYTNKQ